MIQGRRVVDASDVAHHYDELDRYYRELWGEDLHHGLWLRGDEDPMEAAENLTRLIAERGGVGADSEVCDVGCGYGGLARFLAREYGARVVGLTLSGVQHRHAERRSDGDDHVRFLQRDWLDNGLADESFDVVVGVESASHMQDKVRFLEECHRVARPDGRVVIAAWLAAERPASWHERHLLRPICEEGRLPGLATESEYTGWMENAGLHLLTFEDLSAGVARTWTWCLHRVGQRMLTDPEAWRYLLDRHRSERRFALTVARMWLAFRVGALRYGIFTARPRGGGMPGTMAETPCRKKEDVGAAPRAAALPRKHCGKAVDV